MPSHLADPSTPLAELNLSSEQRCRVHRICGAASGRSGGL